MIHDYYLKKIKEYNNKELAWKKKEIQDRLKTNKMIDEFYPNSNDLQNLPQNSTLIKIFFKLKKPYTSKNEGEFYIIDGNIFENPIVRDKFTGLPMVRPSVWKGHLRFSAERVGWKEEEEKKLIIKRLFGSEDEKDETLKGRLYFFPTFFNEEAEKYVITPLQRATRTPKRGPISLEVMKPGKSGDFYLLYIPYPRDANFKEDEIRKDLKFSSEALRLMFYVYGFSAKKTSGFGVIEESLGEAKIWLRLHESIAKKQFSRIGELQNKIEEFWKENYNVRSNSNHQKK